MAGLVLAAAQAPLYRILEGYLLWPPKIRGSRIKKHQRRRRNLVSQQQALAGTEHGVKAGLLYERAARYPVQDRQFSPTALGNAIRRFETYAGDRYQLDSQLLWHHLRSVAPDRAVDAVSKARTNVDFFVCPLYGGALSALFGVAIAVSGHAGPRTWAAIIAGVAIAVVCYRLAVLATDEWDAAVCALVDHSRAGVAATFGLQIPADFTSERFMWRAVNTLVRRPYAYSEQRNIAAIITQFRKTSAEEPTPLSPPSPNSQAVTGRDDAGPGHTPTVIADTDKILLAVTSGDSDTPSSADLSVDKSHPPDRAVEHPDDAS